MVLAQADHDPGAIRCQSAILLRIVSIKVESVIIATLT